MCLPSSIRRPYQATKRTAMTNYMVAARSKCGLETTKSGTLLDLIVLTESHREELESYSYHELTPGDFPGVYNSQILALRSRTNGTFDK